MSGIQHDDEFRDFVVISTPALFRTAFMLTGDRGHAEDLVQTALMKTSRRWTQIENREARYAYVRRVMVNTQTSWFRRRRVIENFVDVVPESDAQVDDFQAMEGRTLPALAQLPERMRAVLVLRFYEDLGEAETARLLGCSVGTVKSQTSRGLARLRTYFADERPHSEALRKGS
ncbi:MAG: SigE family RNA polymerase sigma factor [Geodermatophilaceae bacterium]|nr:SigE family RNA polymerase sigma factor [Geodermatophilaceae bacterium]